LSFLSEGWPFIGLPLGLESPFRGLISASSAQGGPGASLPPPPRRVASTGREQEKIGEAAFKYYGILLPD